MLTALAPADAEAILPLDKLKARVRVIDTAEDDDIRRMRLQAIDFVERYSGHALGRRQFIWDDKQFVHALRLPIGPVVTVDGISYHDTVGAEIDLTSDAWFFGSGTLRPAHGTRWPYADGVRITFTAGFEDAETEAPSLIAAVELLVGHLFANREAVNVGNIVTAMPFGVASLCDMYRVPSL